MLNDTAGLAFDAFQWLALTFFILLNGGYIALNVLTFFTLPRYMSRRVLAGLPQPQSDYEPPVSIVLTAYNEEAVIVDSVRSLLQIDYSEFEIIVVNDGSSDRTLEVLTREFDLVEFPATFRPRVAHKPVRAIFQSRSYPELRVVDKENGGRKSDAANAGINAARFPLVGAFDADTVVQRDSIRKLARPFIEEPHVVACGGIVRILNGCQVSGGFLTKVGLPRRPLALVQIVEYMRAFMFGRIGWSAVDALPLISGAFGLFHKETLIALGGYRHDTVGEDMELVLRIHSRFRLEGRPYRVMFVPDPVCWTDAPEDLRTLRNQRIRWQRGLLECMSIHRRLIFNPKAGTLGLVTLPFLMFFEGFGPVVELLGYLVMFSGFATGALSPEGFFAFMAVALGLGICLTLTSVLLEELSYDTYPRLGQVLLLVGAAVVENFGYRQLTVVWRLQATWSWLRGRESSWGRMNRTATLRAGAAGVPGPARRSSTAGSMTPAGASIAPEARAAIAGGTGSPGTSILGSGLTIAGDVEAEGTVYIAGRVEGTVRSADTVVVREGGWVAGEVIAREAVVGGRVSGSTLIENRLLLEATGRVEGRITAGRMAIEEGATMNGSARVAIDQPDRARLERAQSTLSGAAGRDRSTIRLAS